MTPAFTHEQNRQALMKAAADEDKFKYELDQRYQSRLNELEKRSLYLDRSLELIEELKSKFVSYESQQHDYNQLLMKYNTLLF